MKTKKFRLLFFSRSINLCTYWTLVRFRQSKISKVIKTKVKKGKTIPVTGHGGQQGCEMSRLPHFLDNQLTDGGEVVSLTRQAIPVTGHGGQQGCETSRLPHFLDNQLTDGGEVVSLTRLAILVKAVEAYRIVRCRGSHIF
jgi:hypothetical protein